MCVSPESSTNPKMVLHGMRCRIEDEWTVNFGTLCQTLRKVVGWILCCLMLLSLSAPFRPKERPGRWNVTPSHLRTPLSTLMLQGDHLCHSGSGWNQESHHRKTSFYEGIGHLLRVLWKKESWVLKNWNTCGCLLNLCQWWISDMWWCHARTGVASG